MKRWIPFVVVAAVMVSSCGQERKNDEIEIYIEKLEHYARIAASVHLGDRGAPSILKTDVFIQDQGDTVIIMFLDKAPLDEVPMLGRFGTIYYVNKERGEVVERKIVQ